MSRFLAGLASFVTRFISAFYGPNTFTGLLPDPRSTDEKAQDWLHEERLPIATADPYGNTKITASPYPYMNQYGTSSCVHHAIGLALAIERATDASGPFIVPAPIFSYRQRSNYPQAGSYPPEAFAFDANTGLPPYPLCPTPQTEAAANAVVVTTEQVNEAKPYAGKAYFSLETPNEIDAMARVTGLGHAMPMCLFATYNEWAQEYPAIYDPSLTHDEAEIQHEICALPHGAFYENGVKYIAIQDSAWFGGFKLRYLSESFIRSRVTSAGYWDSVQTIGSGPKPKYHFTETLTVGARGEEVRQMQLLLISEGLLPSDCATGLFGGLSLAGVKDFQVKYQADILTPEGLSAPVSKWGPGCVSKANALCA